MNASESEIMVISKAPSLKRRCLDCRGPSIGAAAAAGVVSNPATSGAAASAALAPSTRRRVMRSWVMCDWGMERASSLG